MLLIERIHEFYHIMGGRTAAQGFDIFHEFRHIMGPRPCDSKISWGLKAATQQFHEFHRFMGPEGRDTAILSLS